MEKVLKKGMEKLFGKIADADLIEPLGDLLMSIVQFLDVDQAPEIKIKFMRVKATDYETGQKESFTCIGFRTVEPSEKYMEAIGKEKKK